MIEQIVSRFGLFGLGSSAVLFQKNFLTKIASISASWRKWVLNSWELFFSFHRWWRMSMKHCGTSEELFFCLTGRIHSWNIRRYSSAWEPGSNLFQILIQFSSIEFGFPLALFHFILFYLIYVGYRFKFSFLLCFIHFALLIFSVLWISLFGISSLFEGGRYSNDK